MKVIAPFTQEQVKNLNDFQECGYMHPFTCGFNSQHSALVAREDGWHCLDCSYTQDWAHDFMANQYWQRFEDALAILRKDRKA